MDTGKPDPAVGAGSTPTRAVGAGSTTNASDAVDQIELPSNPSTEQKLDAGVKETFPASDPVSVPADAETVQPPPLPKRSADWLFDRHGAEPARAT